MGSEKPTPKVGQEYKSRVGLRRIHRLMGQEGEFFLLATRKARSRKDWDAPFPVTLTVLRNGFDLVKEAPNAA